MAQTTQQCPACNSELDSFGDSCSQCGWSARDAHLPRQINTGSGGRQTSHRQQTESDPVVGGYLQMALDAIKDKDYHQALNWLNRAIIDAAETRLGECYSLRGFVRLRLGQFEHAEDDCTQSIKRRGNDAETLAWRAAARAELMRWRLAFEDLHSARLASPESASVYSQQMQNYLPAALEWFQTKIQNSGQTAELFSDRGWVYLLSHEGDKAMRDFRLALEQDDAYGAALVGIAQWHLDQAEFDDAIRAASQAIQLDDRVLTQALSRRARAYAAAGHLARAVEDVTRLREKLGDSQDGLLLCASLRTQLGDFAGAIDDLNLAESIQSPRAIIFAERGNVYAEMRNYDAALADYARYLEQAPNDERIWLKRANIHLRQHQLDEAMRGFDRALEIDDVCPAAYLGRCLAYMEMGNHSQALIESEKALRLDSRNPDTYFTRGKIYQQQKRFKQADAEFEKAARLTDDRRKLAEILYQHGVTQVEMGNSPAAIDFFKRASELRPRHAGTHVWRAATSAKLDDWADAIEQLQMAISLRPSASRQYRQLGRPVAEKAIQHINNMIQRGQASADLYRNRGRANQFLGNREEAIADFTVTLNAKDRDPATVIQRAQLLIRNGKHQLAIKDLSKIIKRHPEEHPAYFARARALIEADNHEGAMRDISLAIDLAPGECRYHVLRGDLKLARGDIEAAIKDYAQATVLDPDDHLAYRKRGSCYLRKNSLLHAIADLTRSIELFALSAESHVLRGQAYVKNSQYEQARHEFEAALTLDAQQIRAYCGLGTYYAMTNRHETGLIWLTKALHRFEDQRDVAELLMTRGKIFYQMGRFPPAIMDFSAVLEMQREDPKSVAAARCARAIVLVQHGDLIRAKKEFDRVLAKFPDHAIAQAASQWLINGNGPRPAILQPPDRLVRPTRPPLATQEKSFDQTDPKWESAPPFDLWIVRTEQRREYGPVSKSVLDEWVRQGRITKKTRLLKSGWPKWRKASSVYEILNLD